MANPAAQNIPPELPSGFRDYLPANMIARSRMMATIREVVERFGFDPIETPAVERWSVLTGDDADFRMVLFETRSSGARRSEASADDRTALRFDLTVPLARVVAANTDLPRPFKRYQVGSVWRGEKPQVGRYREFTQFDADIVGSATPAADAEIIAFIVASLRALGVERFEVRCNNRKILNGLPAYAGFDAALAPDVLRIIDKLPKIGRDAVLRELTKPVR
ncbi:MAG: HisS family protein, partial [bacterium]|nr:HisS family protein [bacterium]